MEGWREGEALRRLDTVVAPGLGLSDAPQPTPGPDGPCPSQEGILGAGETPAPLLEEKTAWE